MYLFIVQCIAAAFSLLISIQGLSEVSEGLTLGILKTIACPIVWLYLARKLNSFHPSILFVVGGIFFSVVLIPSVTLPALLRADNFLFSAFSFATFSALVLWSAHHARWAQTELFNKDPAL